MLTLDDIIQITVFQTLLGQSCLNVFHYRLDYIESAVTYSDLISTFMLEWSTGPRTIQNSACVTTGARLDNLTNGLDFIETVVSLAGTADSGGETMPPFVSWGYKLVRSTKLTRNGAKRFTGVSEQWLTNGVPNSSFSANLAAVAAWLDDPIQVAETGSEDFTLTPVIVGRYPQGDANVGELDLSRINDVAVAQFRGVTSQVSRKP